MNKHIELVKKWLANPESVSRKELFKNKESASFAADDVYLTPACTAADAAYWAAYWAYHLHSCHPCSSASYKINLNESLKKYEELTK